MDILGDIGTLASDAEAAICSAPAQAAAEAPEAAPVAAVAQPVHEDRFSACMAFTWLPQNDGQPLHITAHDAGGATSWGVTLATFAAWRAKSGLRGTTAEDLGAATQDELATLIRSEYWNAVQGDHLPLGADLLVFDFGFVSGSGRSARILQQVLGVAVDGQLGPHTLAAAQACDRVDLIRRLAAAHEAFYRGLRDFAYFGRGWTNRNNDRLAAALACGG